MLEHEKRRSTAASPTLLIVLAAFAVRREKHGPDWCRRKLVGRMREMLDSVPMPDHIVTPSAAWSIAPSLAEAKEIMAVHCRICGGCPMSKV